jgi:hypothetical protein
MLVCLRYNSTRDTLQFRGTPLLVGFIDSNWDSDPDDQKYTVGYVFSLGLRPVTWSYKKQ